MSLNQGEVASLREWVNTWPDGPNWADPNGGIPVQKGTLVALIEIAEAAHEWHAAERVVAIESLPYLGLGPDDVFERQETALKRLRAAL